MSVFIVSCNYNAGSHLRDMVESVHANIRPYSILCVVDNASRDDGAEVLKKMQAEKKVNIFVTSERNIGKAKAVNCLMSTIEKGLPVDEDDLVFSLDSDISLLTPNFFDKLIEWWGVLKDKVSCVVCQQLGNSLFKRSMEWRDGGKGFHYFADPIGYGIAGGAIITPMRHWRMVGGYDVKRGLYGGNDGQLMLNLHRLTGKPMCVVRELQVFHPYEDDSGYRKWKEQAHQQQLSGGKCVFDRGYFDK